MPRRTDTPLSRLVMFRLTQERHGTLTAAGEHLDVTDSDLIRRALDYYYEHAPELSKIRAKLRTVTRTS